MHVAKTYDLGNQVLTFLILKLWWACRSAQIEKAFPESIDVIIVAKVHVFLNSIGSRYELGLRSRVHVSPHGQFKNKLNFVWTADDGFSVSVATHFVVFVVNEVVQHNGVEYRVWVSVGYITNILGCVSPHNHPLAATVLL